MDLPTLDPIAFQAKWRTASLNLKQRTASQSYFNDRCALVGVQNPIEADPVGDTYTFEKGAEKAGGGDGWADVWYKRHFAWEYKGFERDPDAAYVQLLKYKDALENPPLLIVCDLDRIEIRTNFTNTTQETHVITLDDLAEPGKLAILKRVWTAPESFHPGVSTEEVTRQASAREGRGPGALDPVPERHVEDPQLHGHRLHGLPRCHQGHGFPSELVRIPSPHHHLLLCVVPHQRTVSQRTYTSLVANLSTGEGHLPGAGSAYRKTW